jgi:hypothetical protein
MWTSAGYRARPTARSDLVARKVVVDLAGDVALEHAHDLKLRPALGGAAIDIGTSAGLVAHADHDDPPQGGVGLAVAAAVEAVAGDLARGRLDGGHAAEIAGAQRFRSKAAFARWNGTAPIPVWSGSTNFRLNRGGNRQVNAALHRIAVTQSRGEGAGRSYLEARLAAGDSKTEALRMLRRKLSDEVLRRLLVDELRLAPTVPRLAA